MKIVNNKSFLAFLTLVFIVVFGCWFISGNQDRITNNFLCSIKSDKGCAQQLFLEVWFSLKDEYLDKTHNKQDWLRWKNRYINRIENFQDAYVAIDSMVESLNDPYTRFLKPNEFEDQNMSIDAKLFGIGVNIAKINDDTVIVDVLENTPAEKSKMQIGDIIQKVNTTAIKGFTLRKVAELVRGEAGSTVSLTILRDKKKILKDITREEIELKSVKHKIIDKDIAYIKITNFISQDTAIEVAEALDATINTKGIIIDLRGNHGGLLPNAVLIANMFIQNGKIVSIVDRDGFQQDITAQKFNIHNEKPVIVLINRASASASEILSGALKDHKRAILVGETTYGKGLVQKIKRLPNKTGINITIAKYLTPAGTDINKIGINPDYKVELDKKHFEKKEDPQLDKAKLLIKTDIKELAKAS